VLGKYYARARAARCAECLCPCLRSPRQPGQRRCGGSAAPNELAWSCCCLIVHTKGAGAFGQTPCESPKHCSIQQIVFVGGTCGSIHVESFNRNMKSLGVLESKRDPIRKKLVRRFLREQQDKVLRSYFAQKRGTRSLCCCCCCCCCCFCSIAEYVAHAFDLSGSADLPVSAPPPLLALSGPRGCIIRVLSPELLLTSAMLRSE
jgi:hypothetical protein